jgi:anion-transporting  ArsA/GET3 family ATPase
MRILIYLGTGGVGKTSVSAATALQHARRGIKSLVLTTDPARRLRTALQMQGHLQEQVKLDPPAAGELWAEMLDVRGTLDEAVRMNTAPDLAERILKHPIYASIGSSLAGMQELMAIERLYQLMARGFDDIVIDTAPSRHALEFLDKPASFASLADSHWVRLVGRTYRFVEKTGMLSLGGKTIDLYKRVETILGATMVQQVLDFYSLFLSNAEGYAKRAEETLKLLRDPAVTEFRVVTTPQKAVRDADYFQKELSDRGYSAGAIYVNRVWQADPGPETFDGLAGDLMSWYQAIGATQLAAIEDLKRAQQGRVVVLPELARDVEGLDALERIAGRLDTVAASSPGGH